MNDGTVGQLFMNVGRLSGDRKLGKSRTATACAPTRHSDGKCPHLCLYSINIDPASPKLAAKAVIVVTQRIHARSVEFGNLIGGQRKYAGHAIVS